MLRLCMFRVLLLSAEAFNLYCYASLLWCWLLSIPNVSMHALRSLIM